jgi:hypothetical protein
MDFLHDWDKAEQNARLAEGRRKAGVERQKKAEPEREKLNKSVKDIFNDPHKLWWSDKKIANSLESRFSYTRSTLEKYVAEEAAKHRRARKVAADENNSPELRGRMYAELAQYVAPKRKAIEHSADFGGGTFADFLMSLGSCSDGAKAESLNSTDEEQK